jgi:hypothetical protein
MSKEGRDVINKTENSFIQIFGVHMIWIISVLSLMPKGEIVGIKLVLPSVTTLSIISEFTEQQNSPSNSVYRAPGNTEFTEHQRLPSNSAYRGIMSTE